VGNDPRRASLIDGEIGARVGRGDHERLPSLGMDFISDTIGGSPASDRRERGGLRRVHWVKWTKWAKGKGLAGSWTTGRRSPRSARRCDFP